MQPQTPSDALRQATERIAAQRQAVREEAQRIAEERERDRLSTEESK